MRCATCLWWRPPPPKNDAPAPRGRRGRGPSMMGVCQRDRQMAHQGYSCKAHLSTVVSPTAAGLLPAEIAWIRQNRRHASVQAMGSLYRRMMAEPQDIALREAFAAELRKWRGRRLSNTA